MSIAAIKITTNHRQRKLDPETDTFQAYGQTFNSEEIEVAPDSLKALGWEGYYSIAVGCGYVFRYFDSDGYEFEFGPIVGFYTNTQTQLKRSLLLANA